jgi:hypothetical protein
LTSCTESIQRIKKTRAGETDKAEEHDLCVRAVKEALQIGRTEVDIWVMCLPRNDWPAGIVQRGTGGWIIVADSTIVNSRTRSTLFREVSRHGTRPRLRRCWAGIESVALRFTVLFKNSPGPGLSNMTRSENDEFLASDMDNSPRVHAAGICANFMNLILSLRKVVCTLFIILRTTLNHCYNKTRQKACIDTS